jgi:ATP-binding cassette subfamily B protein
MRKKSITGNTAFEQLGDDELTTMEEVPEELEQRVDALLANGEEIKVAVSTDLKFDGNYGKDWLVATDKRLIAFNQNGAPEHQIQEISLASVSTIEIVEMYGNNILKVKTSDKAIEVARYSRRFSPKFELATPELETLVQDANPEAEHEKQHRPQGLGKNKNKCEKCGQPLPRWSGVCISCVEKRKLIFRLIRYSFPFWHIAVPALVLMMIIRFVSLLPTVLSQEMVDNILLPAGVAVSGATVNAAGETVSSPTWGRLSGIVDGISGWLTLPVAGSWGHLLTIVFLMAGFRLFTLGASAVRGYMMAWVGQNITRRLRNETYEHLNSLSLDFYNQRDTGNLMSRITSDVARLRDFIANGLQDLIGDSFTLINICIFMFLTNWKLASWTLIPVPCLIFFTIFFGKKMGKVFSVLWKRHADISTILASTIPGVRVVKAFARERYEINRFSEKTYQVFDGEMNAAKLSTLYRPIMEFIIFSGSILIWLVGGSQIFEGFLTLGELFMFQALMGRFFRPVYTLCQMNERFIRAATSADRVFEIIDTPPSVVEKEDAIVLEDIKGDVEFKDVYFSYDTEKNAINGISFRAEAGEMIGLVGHSGAGKSTVINLITRFYDPSEGSIEIDGHDTRDIKLKALRQQVGVVLQDPFLFQGTIAENIGYSKPGASRHEIIAAAKAANAHEFIIKFPDGYDTMVGERGARVSGGERQRISIARAILKDPRILILDEATSSVDTETESNIQEALERLVRGRTVFAIAHRLSTLKYADRLVVLKDGKVDEIGTHEELLAKDGTYAVLCEKQTELSKIRAL